MKLTEKGNLEGLKSVFSKRCASKIWWGVSEVRFKKNSTPSPWKRQKTTSSAVFCATGVWGLIFFLGFYGILTIWIFRNFFEPRDFNSQDSVFFLISLPGISPKSPEFMRKPGDFLSLGILIPRAFVSLGSGFFLGLVSLDKNATMLWYQGLKIFLDFAIFVLERDFLGQY